LGQIIPPSIVLILLGDQISNAYVDAQRAIGNFSPEPVSVGDLFAGALLPGLLLVAMYILYQLAVARLSPESSPAIAASEIAASGLARRVMRALVPPLVLIVAVLGSILAGVATPTEAASVGAVGAMLLAGLGGQGGGRSTSLAAGALAVMLILANSFDLRVVRTGIAAADMVAIAVAAIALAVLIWGLFVGLVRLYLTRMPETGTPVLVEVARATMRISAMVFVILIGASVFSLVFRGLGGDDLVHRALSGLPGGVAGAVIGVMVIMFLLGFFLDFIEIIFVVVPIVAPVLLGMGLNPVWLGVMMAMNLQTSFLTPPFGFALFYLRGVAPKEVTTAQIYRGVLPFVAIQLAVLALLAFYPRLATWLPQVVFG
ncbi:MAG TPA: TRAP transporter large permease subunit, partial [Rhodospirillaceae bacterium]|nr:TRAP transporter large permease subunit [Rhodospirillaceae bacterium]